ncbi:MAG: hypothetical protein KC731_31775 [Myxococcales bacterium]|nr:hypothetical protein [Myxococcales bacterium]
MKKIALSLAACLALALAATTSIAPAQACGGYGPVSEEDRASDAVWVALYRAELAERVDAVHVSLQSADRGEAEVSLRERRQPLRLTLVRRDGRWRVSTRSARAGA